MEHLARTAWKAILAFAITLLPCIVFAEQFSNFALTTLAAPIGQTDTTLTVTASTNFPTIPPFRLTIQDSQVSTPEIVWVTSISGNTYTIVRGYEGSTASAHIVGAQVGQFVTAGVITNLNAVVSQISSIAANTFLGNITAGQAAPTALTASQVASTILTQSVCSLIPSVCGSFYGYSDVRWFGATCPQYGGHDDTPAFQNAIAAANSGGWNAIFIPPMPAKCLILHQLEIPSNGFTISSAPQNITYNGNAVNGGAVYFNSGYTGGWSSANNCGIDENGHADLNIHNINFIGDGTALGTVGICNSFNTVNANEPQPRLFLDNVSFSQLGNSFGCSITTSGNTGLLTCNSGTGSTQNNLMTVKGHHVVCNEGGTCGAGNITDLQLDQNSEIAGMACGGIVGINSGNSDIRLSASRIENSAGGGQTGVCAAGGPGIEVTGSGWSLTGIEFQLNGGPAILFDKAYSNFNMTGGHMMGDGEVGVAGAESEIVFKGTGTAHSNVTFTGVDVGQVGIGAAKYLSEYLGALDSPYTFTGGSAGSIAYTVARDNFSTEATIPSYINVSGEINVFGSGVATASTALTITGSAFPTNAALGNYFYVQLNGVTIAATNPTNLTDGQVITYEIQQPASGSADGISWGSAFDFGANGAPTLSTTNGAYDLLAFRYSARKGKLLYLGAGLGF